MGSLFLKAEDSNEEIASYLSFRISMPSVSASYDSSFLKVRRKTDLKFDLFMDLGQVW